MPPIKHTPLKFALVAVLACGFSGVAFAVDPPVLVSAVLGVGGQYKLGCWAPLRLGVDGGSLPLAVDLVAIAPDSDGVGVATTTPANRPLSTEPGRVAEGTLYVRIGKADAPIEVRLMSSGKLLEKRVLSTYSSNKALALASSTSATIPLFLEIGGDLGLEKLVDSLSTNETWRGSFGRETSLAALPRDWIGYESFDVVLLGTSKTDWWRGLNKSDARIVALRQWVESGGKLILSCGADGAEVLTPNGPFADLAPGEFASLESLSRTTALEQFAELEDEAQPIELEGGSLSVTRLENTRGMVEAYDGRSPDEMPLVIRAPLGFGEIIFLAVDLNSTALSGWTGRKALLGRLLRDVIDTNTDKEDVNYLRGQSQSLVSNLIGRLDASFTNVSTTPFLVVVGLVLLYLALIGPGDYFFVKRVIGRAEATWITFPLIVIGTSAGAYAAAYWLKGDKLQVNQVEIIDVESSSGLARGAVITHLYSPRAERYNLNLQARTLAGSTIECDTIYTAWLGNPGYGINGMQSAAGGELGRRSDYSIDPTPLLTRSLYNASNLQPVRGMPVQVWSTKTAFGRWTGKIDRSVDSELLPTDDGLVEGGITNDSGADLEDCRLLYGDWAWRLGALNNGQTAAIDDSIDPIRINTLLKQTLRDGAQLSGPSEEISLDELRWRELTIESLAPLFSVRSKLKGAKGQFHPSQLSYGQLTQHLEAGRALLMARCPTAPLSELLRDSESMAGENDNYYVFCRFILDVQ